MTIDRRRFLSLAKEHVETIAIGAVGLGFGATKLYEWNAERVLRRELTEKAVPVLIQKSHEELDRIPRDGEYDIKKFFNGVIFKIPRLVDIICSDDFVQELADVTSDDAKHTFLIETFTRYVVSHTQVNARVESAADTLGDRLDRKWSDCCLTLAEQWSLSLRPHNRGIGATELLKDLEPTIRARLTRAMELAFGADQMPFLRSTEEALGKSALLLLELSRVTERLYLPSFCLQAMQSTLEDVRKYLHDRQNDYRNKISREFVELTNRIGGTFATALRLRVSDLHAWQEKALLASIAKRSKEATAWFA